MEQRRPLSMMWTRTRELAALNLRIDPGAQTLTSKLYRIELVDQVFPTIQLYDRFIWINTTTKLLLTGKPKPTSIVL
ncbi:hypothetical protein BLOT_014293 [Blomia tropicalis]|nr:hypothetical protein BLOT_014293 [Blomia tropicalis]